MSTCKCAPVRWTYRKGATGGDALAMNHLGVMYEEGRGVAQNDAEAVRWYRKGAAGGNALAMNNLGFMYEEGRGVAQDYAEALRWYLKAAARGDELAVSQLKRLGEKP